jgi:hypothetical protein
MVVSAGPAMVVLAAQRLADTLIDASARESMKLCACVVDW